MVARLIAIIGLGTFGIELSLELAKKGSKVIAVDKNPKTLEKVEEAVFQTIQIDSTDEIAIKNTIIPTVDAAIIAMSNDVNSSILTTAILKNFQIPRVIARASSPIHEQILDRIGADEIINIEVEQGKRIASRLVSPNIIDQYSISDQFSFAEIITPAQFINKTLPTLDLRNKYSVTVVLIKRKEFLMDEFGNPFPSESIIIPDATEVLQETDILIVVGDNTSIKQLKEL